MGSKDYAGLTRGILPDKPGSARYGLLCDVLTYVPGLMLTCLVLYYQNQLQLSRSLLLLLTVPSVAGLGFAVLRWRIKSASAIIAVASYWGIFEMLLILGLQGFAVFFFVLIPLLLLFFVALATSILVVLRVGFIWVLGAILAGLLLGITVAKGRLIQQTFKRHPVVAQDPLPIAAELETINRCAHLFHLLHPAAGYPESLQQLGQAGSGCVPEPLLSPEYKGFALAYQPGAKDAAGKIESYVMIAEQSPPHGADFSVVSNDESGLILYRFQGPQGGGIPYPYFSIASTFQHLTRCLQKSISDYKSLPEMADRSVQACWRENRLGGGYTTSSGSFRSYCFNIEYRFETNKAGEIDAFVATGQPVIYGECRVRNYLIEGHGYSLKMYATAENRHATTSDPPARMCELEDLGDCRIPAEID